MLSCRESRTSQVPSARNNPISTSVSVGAGLAGLACADVIKDYGIRASVYEAATRVGRRCCSLRGLFPGQVAERGSEFIDNLRKIMLGYAQRFKLAKEDVSKPRCEVFYHFYGWRYSDAAVVAGFRDFIATMRIDLNRLLRTVTATTHTPQDIALDRTNLLAYLEGQNGLGVPGRTAGQSCHRRSLRGRIWVAAETQNCLNFCCSFTQTDGPSSPLWASSAMSAITSSTGMTESWTGSRQNCLGRSSARRRSTASVGVALAELS